MGVNWKPRGLAMLFAALAIAQALTTVMPARVPAARRQAARPGRRRCRNRPQVRAFGLMGGEGRSTWV